MCVQVLTWARTCSPAWDSPMMKRSPGPSAAKIKERFNNITHVCATANVRVCVGVCHLVESFHFSVSQSEQTGAEGNF